MTAVEVDDGLTPLPPTSGPPPEVSAKLRGQVTTSLGWSMFNNIASRMLTVVFGIVMARLLTPEQFGVYAVGLLALGAMQSMNELGVSVAIVRWPTDPSRLARTAVTLSIASSVILFTGSWLAAPWIANAFDAPEATSVLRILAFCILFDGASSIPNALLTRSFLQGRRTIADLVAIPVTFTIAVSLAVNGAGGASLAWGTLVGNAVATTLIYVLAPGRPRPGWRADDAKTLLRFGIPLATTSFLLLAVLNVSPIITGRILGAEALGLYMLAFNIASWPNTLVSVAVRRVAIPAFGQLQNEPEALERSFAKSLGWVTALALMACLLVGMLARPVISVLYGDRWLPAVAALQWLAVLGTVRVMLDLCYDVLVSVGRTKALFVVQIVWFAALLPALTIGATIGGVAGAAAAHSLVTVAVAFPAYLIAMQRAGIRAKVVLPALARPLLAGAAGAAVLLLGRRLDLGPWAQLIGLGGLAGLVFLAVLVPYRDARGVIAGWRSRRFHAEPSPA